MSPRFKARRRRVTLPLPDRRRRPSPPSPLPPPMAHRVVGERRALRRTSLLFLSSRLLTSPEHIKSSVSGRSISAQSVDVCPEEGGGGGGRERREVGGGRREERGEATPPQSSAGDSQADQSGPQSKTIRLSDVQLDSECSRRGVITVLAGVTLIKTGLSRWNEILFLFCFVTYKRNRFYSTRSSVSFPFHVIWN